VKLESHGGTSTSMSQAPSEMGDHEDFFFKEMLIADSAENDSCK